MKKSIDREGEDEPLTEDDWAAIREGKEAIRRGEFISLEKLEQELGLAKFGGHSPPYKLRRRHPALPPGTLAGGGGVSEQ